MSSLPKPQYTIWQAITAALALGERNHSEIRALAREPGPKGDKGETGDMGIGFPEMEPFYDGIRTFGFRWNRDGKVLKEVRWKTPMQIYQGVFKADATYERGDTVTWNGALWHCNAENTNTKPGSDDKKTWTLAVKRGQDGKDVVVEKPSPPRSTIPFGDK